jgi:hypothetical protein
MDRMTTKLTAAPAAPAAPAARGTRGRLWCGRRGRTPAMPLLGVVLVAVFAIGLSACSSTSTTVASGPAAPETLPDDSTTVVTPTLSRLTAGGEVVGLVMREPLSLERVREVGAGLGGDVIAVFRTDYACVRPITFGAPDWVAEPSRFAYVDAHGIRERRIAAVDRGLSPPITGWAIAESYWLHWEDQWSQAQETGTTFEAAAVYLPAGSSEDLSADPRFKAVVALPSRRTDSLSPDFPGELLLESEEFPPGLLSEPPIPDCGA